MILAVIGWICLFTLCQSKVITVNNKGHNRNYCCKKGLCLCSSLVDALTHLDDNTLVNITSQLVTLDTNAPMSSKTLNNVTVLGNGTTVMCNNKGSVTCRHCSNIILEGITWDQCANNNFVLGIGFAYASNITISMCTFQYSTACVSALFIMTSGFIDVHKCQFLFNHASINPNCYTQEYTDYNALHITTDGSATDTISVYINETLFHNNGMFNLADNPYRTIFVMLAQQSEILLYVNNSTISASGGLGGYFALQNSGKIIIFFNEAIFKHNKHGGCEIRTVDIVSNNILISSSIFAYNINGSLKLTIHQASPIFLIHRYSQVHLNNLTILGNKGTFGTDSFIGSNTIGQGTGILLWFNSLIVYVKISFCNIINNLGGDSSIIYIEDDIGNKEIEYYNITIVSSNFTNNYGPALYLSNCHLTFKGHSSFSNNTAQSGSAIYFAYNSQISIDDDSTIEFIRNLAFLYGGAIYVDLPLKCLYQGITFTHLPSNSHLFFTNNLAGITGSSLYFSIPESCDIIKDPSNINSIVYTPYQFTYKQLPGSIVPEISTSPYAINLCSTAHSTSNTNKCFIDNENMLGQPIYFNATTYDYYNNVSESVQFLMECINCYSNYRLSDSKILAHNKLSEFKVYAVNKDSDISTNRNITINMTSISSHKYKQLSAVVSIELSTCHSGYIFDTNSQQCICYDHDRDIIQCEQDDAKIKYGHWFGTASSKIRTFSLCPTYYCDFNKRAETMDGYFILPVKQNDQCSKHRVGMACGECTSGYTLAYDSPDCINTNKCSPGMTVLVVILTFLYWIAVVVVVFGLMYLKFNISLGYVYGILFYYSIVDILLGSNLYISVGVFQFTTILSSFAKLTPQFLGKLCFVQGLSGIDQQFIHYTHALAVFLLTMTIVLAARWWPRRISSIVSHCIIRVICLLLLLAYTSLTSTSLQLLRPLYYHDIDSAYVYLSPSIKYFTDRHVVYGIVAWVCGLFITLGFPLLLFLQPFLKSKVNFIKIKPLLDQFQGCYKDQYHFFAAYYLVCRLVIIGIAFANNFNNALYYLQTAGIIIVMIHIWIQPYKSDTLNILDGIILLTMILIINLNSYTFKQSTTEILVIIFVIFPLGLSFFIFVLFSSAKCFSNWKTHKGWSELQDVLHRYVCYKIQLQSHNSIAIYLLAKTTQ